MATLIENAMDISSGYNEYRDVIEDTATNVHIPKGTTIINSYAFYYKNSIESIEIPNSVTQIGGFAFNNTGITGELTIPSNITIIGVQAFQFCGNINKLVIENGVEELGYGCFASCSGITELHLPNSLEFINQAFGGLSNLTTVVLENEFNCNGLDLQWSSRLSAASIVNMLNALADRTGHTAYTLIIGSTNLNKLTTEQIAIAINKNWNLA